MSKEAKKLALEGAANYIDALGGDSRKYRQALANEALDKMAENARELGLDYTPAQTDWEAVAADQAMTIALMKAEQPAQQEPFGYFKAMPFGWTDCAETDEGAIALYQRPQPAQQALDKMAENARELGLDYTPAQTDWEAVAADQAMTIALMKAEQPAQQEPWGACVNGRVFVGRLPDHVRKFSEDEGMPIQWLYTSPQPAQPAQPAQQEPVAKDDADIYEFWARNKETERQQKPMAYGKPWVGLTDEELSEVYNQADWDTVNGWEYERAIEAKLKEKNT